MIDWITAILPLKHYQPIFGGCVMAFDEDGAMTWKREGFRELEGSYESTSVARSHWRNESERHGAADLGTGYNELWISGNPSKFFQGHNLFGSDNLAALVPMYALEICAKLEIHVDEFTRARWLAGDFQLDRVDVAYMLDVGSQADVRDVLNVLGHQATWVNRARGQKKNDTVQWGKRSSRNTVVKFYDKSAEIKSHKLPKDIPHADELELYALGKVRAEVEFHSRFLEKNALRQGKNWHSVTAQILWGEHMKNLRLSGQVPLNPDYLKTLPRKLQKTYMQWETGRDLRSWMSYPTFKRHRNELLPYGIDIGQPFNSDHTPRVISISKVISPVHAPIPAWAWNTPLLKAA